MKKKFIFTIVLFASMFVSCEKDFLDINDDPSQVLDVPPALLLSTIEGQLAYSMGGDAARITGVFMQHFTGASRQFAQYQIYSLAPSDVDNLWRFNLYGGALQDLHLLEKKSEENGYVNYNAISKILLAYGLGSTTDLWGDIPYSEAFKATDNLQPKFDSQQDIYSNIFSLLDQAIALLANPSTTGLIPGNDDLIYKGNVSKWLKFAHSLKARYYLHLSKVNPSNASSALTEAALGFGSNAENCSFIFGTTETTANPFYQFNDQRGDISYSGTLISQMVATGDPRLDEYADTATGKMGAFFGSINSPFDFMTYSELKFVEAEASFRTGDLNTSAIAFNDAVKSSVLRINGVADTVFEATVANETSGTITLDKIMTQKYVAMYANPESWSDWRRTDIPALVPSR